MLVKLRDKGGETEKITINLGYVDLGRVDLLVQEGFYSNRTDFIRTAIRNQLASACRGRHAVDRPAYAGARPARLHTGRSGGGEGRRRKTPHQGGGACPHRADVTPELALATIESITVLGALQASAELKSALAERIQ